MSRFEVEKSSLSSELGELMTELQTTRSSRDQLDQQNKSIYDEMLVLQQQQVNIYSWYSTSTKFNFNQSVSQSRRWRSVPGIYPGFIGGGGIPPKVWL